MVVGELAVHTEKKYTWISNSCYIQPSVPDGGRQLTLWNTI